MGGISKCGDAMMRTVLFEAAQAMLTRTIKWSWLKAWGMKIARHRGMKRAVVAVARRKQRFGAPDCGAEFDACWSLYTSLVRETAG